MSQSNPDLQAPSSEFPPARKSGADADARRSRLREFQSHLLERMQAARSGADAKQNQLGLLIGQQRWLLGLQEAGEIVAVDSITKVPLTQDWYLGLSNIRGTLISVVDFARFQGHALTPIDKDSRIVAFAPALAFNGGLLVTRVLGLRNVGEMVLQSAPANDAGAACYLDSESQIWTELKVAQIVQDPRFLHIGV